MKSGHDLNRISDEGYLIIPLSMSRMAAGHGQDPEWCYEVLQYFAAKLDTYSNDVVFLYTDGLYYNSETVSFEQRKKLSQQTLNHVTALRNLITKKREFMPGAVHYLPFDYVVMNSSKFTQQLQLLRDREAHDATFREALASDLSDREYTEANRNFLLEEIVVSHLLRQHMVELPRTLVRRDIWRLLVYAGPAIAGDVYQVQHRVLSQTDKINPFALAHYDFERKYIIDLTS